MGAICLNLTGSAGCEPPATARLIEARTICLRTRRIGSPLVLFVALHAKVDLDVVPGEPLLVGPVRGVATAAVHGEVTVPLVGHLLSDRVRGMLLPVVAGAAQVDLARIIGQGDVVRGVRQVALRAVPLLGRFVLYRRFFQSLDGVPIALPAERKLWL